MNNYDYKRSKVLHTHLANGATQGTFTYQKNNLELLSGFKTVNKKETYTRIDGEKTEINMGIEKLFKKGWYNESLELKEEFAENDQKELSNVLPF